MNNMRMKRIYLGTAYLLLAMLFGAIIIITFTYVPKNTEINYAFISQFLNYNCLLVVLNFMLSLLLGISLLLTKQKRGLLIGIVLVISGLLVLLDSPPIIQAAMRLFVNEPVNIPWTIFLFIIHSALFLSLLTMTKSSQERIGMA